MKFKELLEKDIIVSFLQETNSITGKLVEIDSETQSIHVHTYYNRADLIIPLISVKTITEKF